MTMPTPPTVPHRFFAAPLDELLADHAALNPETAIVDWFRATAGEVPAYRDFLAAQGLSIEVVADYAAFRQLPLTTKPNYMHAHPLPRRCQGGNLLALDRVAVSSGSTGQPTFWPRAARHEMAIAPRFEQVFRDGFRAHERPTLAVVCFALGNWVGGLYTTACLWHLAAKGYPLLVATPGNKPEEIFRVVRELAPEFAQTVLLGYPPFVKDVIDGGRAEGLDWSRHHLKLVFAGEVFSEEWRGLVVERAGSSAPCYDSASLYGTADGGVLGNETPLSIAARRFLAGHPQAARELFGESRLPTLVQYDPIDRFFETHGDNTLVVSGDNGVPLFRYHIADRGGIVGHARMREFLADWGAGSLEDYGLDPARPGRELPFVYVFGRADFTVSYYGANIYPENIAVGLEQPDILAWASGKFVLEVEEDAGGDSHLRVTAELLPGVAPGPERAALLAASIRAQLLRLNSEFANYTPAHRQAPRVELRPFADPEYFPAGVKHRYTRR